MGWFEDRDIDEGFQSPVSSGTWVLPRDKRYNTKHSQGPGPEVGNQMTVHRLGPFPASHLSDNGVKVGVGVSC